MKLLVATSNPGKLIEVREILAGFDLELTSLAELGLPPPEEPFETFHENAAAKAVACAACDAALPLNSISFGSRALRGT